MDNPVGELAMLPVSYEWLTVKDPIFDRDHTIQTVKAVPTYPVRLGDWRLVNRLALSFPTIPIDAAAFSSGALPTTDSIPRLAGLATTGDPFAGSTSGFGDLAYVGLLTPRATTQMGDGKFIWAAGPTFIFPTASETFLGQGKLQAGPAVAAAYLGEDWTLGVFSQHWWSIGGDRDRSETNHTNIQYFVYRKLPDQWSLGASPTISIDWTPNDRPSINLPIGIGLNKTFFVGKLPVRVGLEANYYTIRSDGIAPEWGLKFSITPVLPAAFLR